LAPSEAKHKEKKMNAETSRSGSTEEGAHATTKVFRDLVVYGDPAVLDSVVPRIEVDLCDAWHRDREREARLWCRPGRSQFCFVRRPSSEFPAVALLMCAEGRRLSVTNIVADGRELSCDKYNSILAEFYLKCLHPAASEAGLAMELSPDEQSLEEGFGWRAADLLRSFSRCTNKSRTHPADLFRWMEFLVHLYSQPNRKYDFDLLATWLIGDGWSIEKNTRLYLNASSRETFCAFTIRRSPRSMTVNEPLAIRPNRVSCRPRKGEKQWNTRRL
jgi:hypothetical protein